MELRKTLFSTEELLKLIPQIDQIRDEAMKKKVIRAWELAFDNGNFESLTAAPFIKCCDSITLCQHTRSVTEMSIRIAEVLREAYSYDIDFDVLIAVAAVHDISKLLEMEPGSEGQIKQSEIGGRYQHGFFSAHYCVEAGMPHAVTSAVFSHTHQTKMMPTNLEGIIVTYADLADADAHRFIQERPLHLKALH